MSKRLRRGLIATALLVVAGVVCLDHYAGRQVRNSPLLAGLRGRDAGKYHLKTFRVVKVVDGDTVDIDIADGEYATTRVRLLGVDTPETKNPKTGPMYFGEEANSFTEDMVLDRQVTILIDTVSDERDRYGRLLAYVKLDDGRVLNAELVAAGFGYADLRFDHSRYDKYASLQEAAIKSGAGLWGNVSRKQLPKWLLRERPGMLGR